MKRLTAEQLKQFEEDLAAGIYALLVLQRDLQIGMKEKNPELDGDPVTIPDVDVPHFLTWNAFALTDEIHEAMAEVSWKPWAKGHRVDLEPFTKEMVDAIHFFANMLLAAGGAHQVHAAGMATRFASEYMAKRTKNEQRQADGYDGVKGKCSICHRELDAQNSCPEHPTGKVWPSEQLKCTQCYRKFDELVALTMVSDEGGHRFCNTTCRDLHNYVGKMPARKDD